MNKRIEELAEEAWPNLDNDPRMIFSSADVKRFAELIIKECDRYVAERFDETEPWMCPGDLLKYFGVES